MTTRTGVARCMMIYIMSCSSVRRIGSSEVSIAYGIGLDAFFTTRAVATEFVNLRSSLLAVLSPAFAAFAASSLTSAASVSTTPATARRRRWGRHVTTAGFGKA